MYGDEGPTDMDELFRGGVATVPSGSVAGQAAGLGGLLAILAGTVSLLTAGAIVGGGVVLGIGGMLLLPFIP